jgi:hypothetical protein
MKSKNKPGLPVKDVCHRCHTKHGVISIDDEKRVKQDHLGHSPM